MSSSPAPVSALPTASLAATRETALRERLAHAVRAGAGLRVGSGRTVHRGAVTETGDVVPACHAGWCHGPTIRAVAEPVTCRRPGCQTPPAGATEEHQGHGVTRQLTLDGAEVVVMASWRRARSR
ncbi:hypothetical protein [Longimycelium tulufanense]|uniref:hypothetical protein n=1 Tax=Longimycelium tulufanense TaxID=907463 RepID=UPI001669CA3B|nr:hypothetical protein [Longimycelium tulufanense]